MIHWQGQHKCKVIVKPWGKGMSGKYTLTTGSGNLCISDVINTEVCYWLVFNAMSAVLKP
jgi:hypothetical protein